MSRQPEALWAQRSDKIYLTVSLLDAKDVFADCEPHGLFTFTAERAGGKPVGFTLELYGRTAPELEGCKMDIGRRSVLCSIKKEQKGWWKRLLKSEEKPAPYIKIDWNRWCDEEDEVDISFGDSEDDLADEVCESSDEEGMLYLPDLEKAGRYRKVLPRNHAL